MLSDRCGVPRFRVRAEPRERFLPGLPVAPRWCSPIEGSSRRNAAADRARNQSWAANRRMPLGLTTRRRCPAARAKRKVLEANDVEQESQPGLDCARDLSCRWPCSRLPRLTRSGNCRAVGDGKLAPPRRSVYATCPARQCDREEEPRADCPDASGRARVAHERPAWQRFPFHLFGVGLLHAPLPKAIHTLESRGTTSSLPIAVADGAPSRRSPQRIAACAPAAFEVPAER